MSVAIVENRGKLYAADEAVADVEEGGGGEAMTDAAVDEVERDGVKTGHNNQPLVWKGWWDSHLYAGRCKNVYILQIKICGVKRHNNKNI